MTDTNKRTTLKIIAGSAVAAAIPVSLASANVPKSTAKNSAATTTIEIDSTSGLQLTLTTGDQPELHMTNNTDDVIIVRHVHPGIVHVGDRTFNLNSVFDKNATGIRAGETRRKPIAQIAATTPETRFAPGVYKEGRLKPAHVVGYLNEEKVLNSSRFYYC